MSISAAAAIGSALIGAGSNIASQGPLSYFYGKRDRRDSSSVDFEQYKKQRIFDYQFDKSLGFDLAKLYDAKDYALARRYSENSASWAVEGLRRAGLNPILAAGNGFNASLGFQGQGAIGGPSVPHSSGNSFNIKSDADLLGAMLKAGSLDVQASTADKLKADSDLARANSNVAQANADNIKAQTLKTYVDAINSGRTGGLSGRFGALQALASDLGIGASSTSAADALKSHGKLPLSVGQQVENSIRWLSGSGIAPSNRVNPPSSAKDKHRWLSDLSTAKDIANEVSPSPNPVNYDPEGLPYYGPNFKLKRTKKETKRVNPRFKH